MTHSTRPTKAVLLAAGLGTRMQPLSYSLPKPLMPIWGVPCIDRMIDMLRGWGVHEFLVNLHHAPDALFNHLRLKSLREGLRIELSFEADILGTGGALAKARWFMGQDPFWMANTDVVARLSPAPLIRAFRRHDALAALWVTDRSGPRTVELDDGRISCFRSARAGQPGTYTFCGLQLLSPAILPYIALEGFSSIISAYEAAIREGRKVLGVSVPYSIWADAGRPETYIEAHKLLLDAKVPDAVQASRRCRRQLRHRDVSACGCVSIGADCELSRAAFLNDSIVMENSWIGTCARADRAVIGPGCRVNRPVSGIVCRADSLPTFVLPEAVVSVLGWQREEIMVQALAERGSDRDFIRIFRGNRSVILIRHGAMRDENRKYARHAKDLHAAGIPVPEVVCDIPESGITVLEDLGDKSLLDEVTGAASPMTIARHYRAVIKALVRLHSLPTDSMSSGLEPEFNAELFAWEHDLFAVHFLKGVLGLAPSRRRAICRELQKVSKHLEGLPSVLLHRDMQSSNIMLHGNRHVFIDFQGLRLGPAFYDVASLLCDPYVMLQESIQENFLDEYMDLLGDPRLVREHFWFAAVQRLVQALGAFGRLSARPGTQRFALHIPGALQMLVRARAKLSIKMSWLDEAISAIQNIVSTVGTSE